MSKTKKDVKNTQGPVAQQQPQQQPSIDEDGLDVVANVTRIIKAAKQAFARAEGLTALVVELAQYAPSGELDRLNLAHLKKPKGK